MLMPRDKEILRWIEEYKAITVKQAQYIFFGGNYECSRRRLHQLEKDMGLIKSYNRNSTKEKVYYMEKKLSEHRLYAFDFIRELYKVGAVVKDIKIEPQYLNDNLRPDMYIQYEHEGYIDTVLLEVDYSHYTSNTKVNTLYEKLYTEKDEYEELKDGFIVVIARPTSGNRYNSRNFDVIYTDLTYSNIYNLLLS